MLYDCCSFEIRLYTSNENKRSDNETKYFTNIFYSLLVDIFYLKITQMELFYLKAYYVVNLINLIFWVTELMKLQAQLSVELDGVM